MAGKKLSLERARQEAKRRRRTGGVKHTEALEQIAVEQGFASWKEMCDDRMANPLPARSRDSRSRQPDFVVELTPIGEAAPEHEVLVFLNPLLTFSGVDQAEWDLMPDQDREELVIEFAFGTRHQKGDFARYYGEVVSGLDRDDEASSDPMR